MHSIHPRPRPSSDAPARLVWDLPLRLFHWLLVLAVMGCWVTYELGVSYFTWHAWLGYATLVLILFRIAWGFVGPKHARFSSFLRGPSAWWRHARTFLSRAPDQHAGHSPLGALMIVILLVLLLVMGITGLFANDEIMNTGPLYGYVSDTWSDRLSRLHRSLMDWLWMAIAVHVAAIAFYALVKRQDLVTSMFTGRKRGRWLTAADEIPGSKLALAALLLGLVALILYIAVVTAPEPSIFLF